MLRRELLKALAAFIAAGPAVAAATENREPEASSRNAGGFTPPTRPAEPQPATFKLPAEDLDIFDLPAGESADLVEATPCPPLPPQAGKKVWQVSPEMQALRESLWNGDALPIEVGINFDGMTRILFFPPESAKRLGTDEQKQALARRAIATAIPTSATIYNGGAACEVWFKRVDR